MEERRVLQLGWITGLLAGVLFSIAIAFVVGLPAPLPGFDPDPEVFLGTIFPENRPTFTAIGVLALGAYLLAFALFLVLYRSLREANRLLALGGLLLATLYLGFIVVAPGELVAHLFVTPQLAELYNEAGTDAGRAAVVQTFQGFNLLSDQLFFAGLLLLFLGALFFGAAMWGHRDFGRLYGGIVLALGLIGFLTLPAIVLEPGIRVPFVPLALWFVLGGIFYLRWRRARGSSASS